MKSRMVKRILAMVMTVTFLAGDVLPITAADMENTPIVDEVKEEVSSLWEDVETPDEEDTDTPAANNDETVEVKEEGNEQSVEEGKELVTIENGEAVLADSADDLLDEDAEEEEEDLEAVDGEEKAEEETEEDNYVTIEPVTVDGVTITVKALKDVVSEGTYVEAIELDPIEVEEIITSITELENEETAENEEVVVKRYKAFDITLYVDKDGEKTVVQPDEGTVTVSFSGDMIAPENSEEVAIYHVDDNDTSDVEKMEEVAVTTDEKNEQVVELVTDHFSKYVITYKDTEFIYTEGTGDIYFKVVDDAGNAVQNAVFCLYESNSNYSFDSEIPENIYKSDSDGSVHIDLTDYHTSKGTYYYVLKQLATSEGLNKASDIHICEEIDFTWFFVETKTVKITVDVNDGSNTTYNNYSPSNKIPIKNTRGNTSITPVEADPGALASASKKATLEDWENRIYKLDLSAVVNKTISKEVSKVVVIGDASGSMTWVDVAPVTLNHDCVYFSNTCGDNAGYTISDAAKARILSYRENNRGSGYVIPSSGYYYYYSESRSAWFKRSVSDSNGLKSANCFTPNRNDSPVDMSGETLYTDRGEAFISALKTLVDNLPNGTKVEFITFNGDAVDVSNGFLTIGTNDTAIENAIARMVPEHDTATKPQNALQKTLESYFHWYENNSNCNVVFFADGDSDGSEDKETLYSNLLKWSGVEIYSVGLKTTGGVLSRVASEGEGHLFLCNQARELSNAMKGISSDISEKTKGRIVDQIDSHFEICTSEGSTEAADLAAAYEGAVISEDAITWNEAEFTVGGTTTYSVYVKAKDDFVGGNVVTTNGTLSVTLHDVTKQVASPVVNVKSGVDAFNQKVTIKKGESLKKDIEKHLSALAPEEGEDDLRFTSAVTDEDYTTVNIKFYKNKNYTGEFFTLEQMKEQKPVKDTTYYVLVEAVPKSNGNDASVKARVEEAMTQNGTYYCLDRELEGNEREAVAKAEYVVKVESAELEIKAVKEPKVRVWNNRTYEVKLGARTAYKDPQDDGSTVTAGDTKEEPTAASNITLYDEISKYFDLTDKDGNVLTSDAEVKAAYGNNAELGYKDGKTTITFKNLSTVLNSDKTVAEVTKTIYLKAKPGFAGGNKVPTNGEYKVSAPDPNYPGTTRENSITTSPTVNVKFEAEDGSDTEGIFLGETLEEYLTPGRLIILKNKLCKDNYTEPADYSFLNEKSDIEWFRKLNEDGTVSEPIADITKEAPTKETTYYGKITISPKYTDETAEYKVEEVEVIGTYKVTVLEGKITVSKTIDDLNAAKALSYDGNPIFTFVLKKKNSEGGYDTVQAKAIDFGNQYQTETKSVTFEKLGKGEYIVEELGAAGWTVSEGYQHTSNAMSISKTNKTGECSFKNKAVKQKAFADKDIAVNSITKGEDGKISFTKKQENNGN